MAVKRKLAVKTLRDQALRDLKNGISNKNVAEKYGVPKNTVCTWLENKEKLFTALEKSSNKRKKVRESNYPDIENAFFKWFLSQRGKSIPIDGTVIEEKGMKYAKELGANDFKVSDGWLEPWKKKVRLFTFSIYFIIYLLILSTSIQISFQYIDALFDSSEYHFAWHLHAFAITQIYRLSRDNYFT